MARKEKLDLILTGVVMPEIDGYAACRKIREWSSVPIIMLNALEGENDKEKYTACGAKKYLTRPFVLRELLSQVKTL